VLAARPIPGIGIRLPVMMLGDRAAVAMAARRGSRPCRQCHRRIQTYRRKQANPNSGNPARIVSSEIHTANAAPQVYDKSVPKAKRHALT
jgi:hypothetical protein